MVLDRGSGSDVSLLPLGKVKLPMQASDDLHVIWLIVRGDESQTDEQVENDCDKPTLLVILRVSLSRSSMRTQAAVGLELASA
jgi:hypothetical protein